MYIIRVKRTMAQGGKILKFSLVKAQNAVVRIRRNEKSMGFAHPRIINILTCQNTDSSMGRHLLS